MYTKHSLFTRCCCFSYLCTYDLYGPVSIVFDACSWRGFGPGNFGPCEMASSRPKNSRFPEPNHLPLAQVVDLHASKIITYRDV